MVFLWHQRPGRECSVGRFALYCGNSKREGDKCAVLDERDIARPDWRKKEMITSHVRLHMMDFFFFFLFRPPCPLFVGTLDPPGHTSITGFR